MSRFIQLGAALISVIALSSPGDATVFAGHITEVYASSATAYAYRVFLDTGASGCGGNFLALNLNDNNYQAKAATLLTGYALGKAASITASPDASGNCVITDLNIVN
jgi:hypothetical protein